MSALSEARKAWFAALPIAARERGLPTASFWAARRSDPLFFEATGNVITKKNTDGSYPTSLSFTAKPWAVDSLLWTTLGGDMGGERKRIGLRAIGAFAVWGDGFGSSGGSTAEDPGRQVDEFLAAVEVYEREVPDLPAFVARVHELRAARPDLPQRHQLLLTLSQMLAGDMDAAAATITERAPLGGDFTVGNQSVWQLLERDLHAGTGIFAPAYVPVF